MTESPTPTSDARAVANYFLAKARVDGVALDLMKLLKLVYIAHGWTLGVTGRPLCTQAPVAWPYGPVFREVYFAFRRFRDGPILSGARYYDYEAGTDVEYAPDFTADQRKIVDRVWEQYRAMNGAQLSALTHMTGTPWDRVTRGIDRAAIRDLPIPTPYIADHYRTLADKNREMLKNAS